MCVPSVKPPRNGVLLSPHGTSWCTLCCHTESPAETHSSRTDGVRTARLASFQAYCCQGRQPKRCSRPDARPPLLADRDVMICESAAVTRETIRLGTRSFEICRTSYRYGLDVVSL